MNNVPKLLLGAGVVLIIVALIWMFLGRFMNLGRLPGDVAVEKGNFKVYFPIVTCIVISVVLSLIMYVVRLFMK
ncbi:DUF2905 domain-containing protein [Paenibacillus mendelii]|uniref:DUF2905 domain-containing protein n=1 Tax=Paenibacillus mendelii TaxID=206163 RepID=A0ABV6JIF6_9BACL|nr:DUF2905 domain-containing protein [Paenibacillus mendelii]MCQ6558219.1 DUF2905 domain-containing protein [Paenibacillus mendelii]